MCIEENKEIVREFEERWGKGDSSVFDELTTNNFIGHWLTSDKAKDVDTVGFKRTVESGYIAFSDYALEIIDMIAEGDKVMVMKKRTGINTGEFLSIPPTGKSISTFYINLYRIENGKVAEVWGLEDSLGLYQQMEVLPSTMGFIQAYNESHTND